MTGRRGSLVGRLLLAQVGVIATAAATIAVVALVVGPPNFHEHMLMVGPVDPMVSQHAEEAFVSSGAAALGVGLAIGCLAALAASWALTRRIGAALGALESAAGRVAGGDYEASVHLPGAGRELEAVAESFTAMAGRLASTEATRRRLLTDLSHELRTPIAAIDLMLEGVEDGVVPTDAATWTTLRAQTGRLARLAADIRDVSAAEEGRLALRPNDVRLPELLDAAATAAGPLIEASGLTLVRSAVPEVAVRGDRARLGQILDNLLRNATQHTPAGGHLWLDAMATADAVEVRVRDDGPGIAAADLPHIFERFYRGTPQRHDEGAGTGVGLAISRAIAEAHGGTLTVSSLDHSPGAEFVLRLPAP